VLTPLIAFALFAALLTITPGPDTLLVLRASASGGPRVGVAAAVGISLGCLGWAVASAVGVTAVLTASQLAFDILRGAGAAYLCWLGARTLWTLRRRRPSRDAEVRADAEPEPAATDERWTTGRAMRIGLTTNLLNPKVGVFYLSVLPQFLPDGLHPLAGSLLLALIHDIEGVLWLSLLALLVTRVRGWLARPVVRRRFEQVTAVIFIGFGLRLALTRS
jgi:threonine/homoserine/homoserine lactone efflux protein